MNITRRKSDNSKKTKKRPSIQSSLERFFPRKKVQKVLRTIPHDYDKQHNTFLVSFSDDILHKGIFMFLTVNDLTELGSTCHLMDLRIGEFRGPLPYIIRQEVMPRKIAYPDAFPPIESTEVSQAQTYRFLLKTKRNGIAQVHIRLSYVLWEEGFSIPETTDEDFFYGEPVPDIWWEYRVLKFPQNIYETRISATITWKSKYKDGSVLRSEAFVLDERKFSLKSLDDAIKESRVQEHENEFDDEEHENEFDDEEFYDSWDSIKKLPSPTRIEDNLHDCMFYYWMCANQSIHMTPKLCPSIHYFMNRTQSVPLLQHCWPKEYQEDPSKVNQDREMFCPWPFVAPKSRKNWVSHAFGEHEIHEIPWYEKWYPKPIVVDSKNVFGCFSYELTVNCLLPYLSPSDEKSLFATIPKPKMSNPYKRPSIFRFADANFGDPRHNYRFSNRFLWGDVREIPEDDYEDSYDDW